MARLLPDEVEEDEAQVALSQGPAATARAAGATRTSTAPIAATPGPATGPAETAALVIVAPGAAAFAVAMTAVMMMVSKHM